MRRRKSCPTAIFREKWDIPITLQKMILNVSTRNEEEIHTLRSPVVYGQSFGNQYQGTLSTRNGKYLELICAVNSRILNVQNKAGVGMNGRNNVYK